MSERILIFDPFAGAAGDMTIAALLDLGLPIDWLRDFVNGLGIGEVRIDAERVDRRGIACTYLKLDLPDPSGHRHLSDILEIIEGANLSKTTRTRAVDAFIRLADAEATVHGTTREKVHFHEVGALDAIVDIIGAVAGVEELGFSRCFTRPVALGRGWSKMAHGNFPVPPPAALNVLKGIAVADLPFEGECTTPTGATLIATLTGGEKPPASFTVEAVGFGAGTRDDPDRPNCLRLIAACIEADAQQVRIVQADLDDMSPEYVAPLLEELRGGGALDVTAHPVQMKKGRIGVRVEVLIESARAHEAQRILLQSGTTLGVRFWDVERETLPRRLDTMEWDGHTVRVKRVRRPDGSDSAKPEFDDVVRVARETGRSPLDVFAGIASTLEKGKM